MNKEILKTLEKLEELLPYANSFVSELKELSNYRQEEQLDHILPFLNKLVEGDVKDGDWPSEIITDYNFIPMIKNLQELKHIRNKITHAIKTSTYGEYMDWLKDIYEYGEEINYIIHRNIKRIKEKYNLI